MFIYIYSFTDLLIYLFIYFPPALSSLKRAGAGGGKRYRKVKNKNKKII